jgi:hypothetical protein
MPIYNKSIYSRSFARLLNKALNKGGGDPRRALAWLERKYHPILAMLFTRHRLEQTDAYMDVREHLQKRAEGRRDVGGDS